jgi:hypothetical protein
MALAGEGGVLSDPAPKARIKGTTGTGVDYKVKYFIDCARIGPGKARHQVVTSVLDQLHQTGLQLAYPKQDVSYGSMPERLIEGKSIEDRIRLLGSIDLFEQLDPIDLEDIAMALRARQFREHETLIRQRRVRCASRCAARDERFRQAKSSWSRSTCGRRATRRLTRRAASSSG